MLEEVKLPLGNDLRFPRAQGYFDDSLIVKWGIAILFTFALFFSLHFREVRVESLELDTPAKRYVVAQTDFDFLDHDATELHRQEALRDIGKIYRLPERELRERKKEIEEEATLSPDWQKQFPEASLSKLSFALDTFLKGIRPLRFTDLKTIEILQKRKIDTSNFEPFEPSANRSEVYIPTYIWEKEGEEIFKEHPIPKPFLNFILNRFESKSWRFEEDTALMRKIRQEVEGEIKEQYSFIGAGDRIIDQGERVTSRHIAELQSMKRAMNDDRNLLHPSTIFGSLILSMLITFVSASYLSHHYPKLFESNRQLFLLVTISIIPLLLSRIFEWWLLNVDTRIDEMITYPLFVPLAAILICHLIGPQVATFAAALITITLTLAETLDLQGMLLNLVASVVVILETRNLKKRKEIFVVCLKAFLACIAVILALHLYENTIFDISILSDIFSAFIFLLFTAVVVIGLLPLFEAGFKVVTDVTLMEYLDPSHELLRRLSIEAPGTYQHSLVIGTLAEAAAMAIGANGLFCRVATLYHDVGKMAMPHYFTENQGGEVNVHKLLTAEESAQAIISHVPEGVAMARRAGLPEPFIDIIKEHHGTSLVWSFYKTYLDRMGLKFGEGDVSLFRYAGPKPQTKEAAIIMLADGFEAASRSLDEVNEETLSALIDSIVETKVEDHQLDECPLTFEEMSIVKKTMIQTILAAGHVRVKYPPKERG